jgi:hypothetical protein
VSRRTIFWLVVALAGTILLAVVGAIVFSLLDKDGALGLISDLDDEVAAYLAVFGLVFADAIVPIFPGETTLTTAARSRPGLPAHGRSSAARCSSSMRWRCAATPSCPFGRGRTTVAGIHRLLMEALRLMRGRDFGGGRDRRFRRKGHRSFVTQSWSANS